MQNVLTNIYLALKFRSALNLITNVLRSYVVACFNFDLTAIHLINVYGSIFIFQAINHSPFKLVFYSKVVLKGLN